MGYPTDCPQREKNGWTGDGHLAIETALYNYDAITVYEKWLADHRDEQQPNGVLPDIIPTGGWGYGTDNGLDWTSTIALIPWNLYLFYGDPAPLEACYETSAVMSITSIAAARGADLVGRGDWVPVRSRSSLELTSSVYFFVDASILARAAELFGRSEDHARYAALAEKIRTAINRKYYNPPTPQYKRLRKIWWGLLIGAIVMTAMSWFGRTSCRGGNLCGAGPGLCVHHRRPVRGLLENPQGATRLSGRDDVQKNQGDARSRKAAEAAQRAAKQKVEEAPAVEEAPRSAACSATGFRLPKKQEPSRWRRKLPTRIRRSKVGTMVSRVYVEKKPGFDGEAKQLKEELRSLLASARLRISAW